MRYCIICGKKLNKRQKKTCCIVCRNKYSGLLQLGHTPWNKGRKMSEEFCKKVSISNKGKRHSPNTEFTSERVKKMWQDPEHKKSVSEKISKALTGKKLSKEQRLKMSVSRKKWIAETGWAGLKGKDNPSWKGDDLTYMGLHSRIRREFGKAIKCEHCKKTDRKLYEWANLDHKYSLDKKDWIQLCRGCHQRYDYKMGFRTKKRKTRT